MKTHITARDIADTLLSEKFLTTLRRASMITSKYHVETMLRPYLKSPTWEPDIHNFVVGSKKKVAEGDPLLQQKVGKCPDHLEGLPLLKVHFHPDERVLVPSGVRRRGDLHLLLPSWRSHWVISSDEAPEELYIESRSIMGIAQVDERYDVNILLFQLKSLPGTWRELRQSYAMLESIDDAISVAYFLGHNVEQGLVMDILSTGLNTALLSIPYQETNSQTKRQEFRERNRGVLENKLQRFATDIVITERVPWTM